MAFLQRLDPLDRAHLEGMRGNIKQNEKYCSKAGDLIVFGDGFVEPGQRRDIQQIYQSVRDGKTDLELMAEDFGTYARLQRAIARLRLLLKPVRDGYPNVLLLIGRPGCGKTRKCYENCPDLWEPPINMSKNDTNWFDGYVGQKEVLLDEFEGHMPLNSLLKLIDRYVRQVPIKNGFTWFNPETIMLTANDHPSTWYDFSNRRSKEQALRRRITRVAYWDELNNDWVTIDNELAEGELATPAMKKWWSSPLDKEMPIINDVLKDYLPSKVLSIESDSVEESDDRIVCKSCGFPDCICHFI